MSETSRSTDAMKIGLRILREIEIDDYVDSLNVYTTGEKVRANEIAAYTVPEVMKYTVTIVLQHLGVRVKAGVSKLGDLLRKQLHSVCGVAEDDRLVDLKFGEQSIEAVDFLFLFYEAVVLCYTSKSELVHQIDFVRISHMFILRIVSIRYRRWMVTFALNDLTIIGKVALKSMTWRSLGWKPSSCSIVGVNSGERSLSASSMTNVVHSSSLTTSFLARSAIRPGVPTMMWTVSCSRMMSSLRPVPPVVTMTLMPRYWPKVLQTCDVCRASSLVGTRIKAWVFCFSGSIFSSVGIMKAAVLPVPFFALANISLPVKATGIVSS